MSSERWSQQFLSDSQDWASQPITYLDAQRQLSRHSSSSQFQNSSQTSSHGARPGMSGRNSSQQVSLMGDVSLAWDIRYGLHTILSVMRDLPNQLKDISGEVLRTSQQPEEPNSLIKETSEKLQDLVLGLEKKLSQLLESKNNSEALHQALDKHEGSLKTLVSRLEDCTNKSSLEGQAVFEEHSNATKKEVRREVKKIREVVEEIKTTSVVNTELSTIQNSVSKVIEMLKGHEDSTQSLEQQLERVMSETNRSFKEVCCHLDKVSDKIGSLPQMMHAQIYQVVANAFQSYYQPSNVVGSHFISPARSGLLHHKPMVPFAETFQRPQVSPVAEVLPWRKEADGPSTAGVGKETVKKHVVMRPETEKSMFYHAPVSHSTYRSSATSISGEKRPASHFASNIGAQNPKIRKNFHGKIQENQSTVMLANFLESGTQRFSPEIALENAVSDSEDSICMQLDNNTSSDESCTLLTTKYMKADLNSQDGTLSINITGTSRNPIDNQKNFSINSKDPPTRMHLLPRPLSTPNVRKAPSMISSIGKAQSTTYVSPAQDFAQSVIVPPGNKLTVGHQPESLYFVQPKPRVSNATPYGETRKTRRCLTPVNTQELKFRFCGKKKM